MVTKKQNGNDVSAAETLLPIMTLVLLLPWLFEIENPFQALLAGLGLVLTSASIAVSLRNGFGPMLAFSSVFVMSWISIPAIYQLAHHEAAWNDSQVLDGGSLVTRALLLHALTQLAVLCGYKHAKSRIRPPSSVAVSNGSSRENSADTTVEVARRLSIIGALLVSVSVMMLFFVVRRVGSFATLFLPRDLYSKATTDLNLSAAGGVLVTIVEIFPYTFAVSGTLLIVLAIRLFAVHRHPVSMARVFWGLLGLVMTWIYANPIANTRFTALAMLGSIVLVIFYPRTKKAGWLIAGAFLVFVLLLYPLANLFNSSLGLSQSNPLLGDSPFAAWATPDFDGFQQSINAFEYVDHRGHSYGIYILSAAFIFVPRSIWTTKATPASIDIAEERGYSFTNLSLPTNAEAYVEFGFLITIFLFFLVGWLFAFLDKKWREDLRWAPLVAFAALAQIGIIRGPLGANTPVWIFVLATLIFATFWIYREANFVNQTSFRATE